MKGGRNRWRDMAVAVLAIVVWRGGDGSPGRNLLHLLKRVCEVGGGKPLRAVISLHHSRRP